MAIQNKHITNPDHLEFFESLRGLCKKHNVEIVVTEESDADWNGFPELAITFGDIGNLTTYLTDILNDEESYYSPHELYLARSN